MENPRGRLRRRVSLAIEYADRGVRSNAVALGVVKTPMHLEASHDTLAGLHPVGRMGEIGDIVDAVVHLENAPFVTGEILHVDGGRNAGHRPSGPPGATPRTRWTGPLRLPVVDVRSYTFRHGTHQ